MTEPKIKIYRCLNQKCGSCQVNAIIGEISLHDCLISVESHTSREGAYYLFKIDAQQVQEMGTGIIPIEEP